MSMLAPNKRSRCRRWEQCPKVDQLAAVHERTVSFANTAKDVCSTDTPTLVSVGVQSFVYSPLTLLAASSAPSLTSFAASTAPVAICVPTDTAPVAI